MPLSTDAGGGELGWLLDETVAAVPAVRHAVVLSTDGLAVASSAGLSREDGEHLAAVASGFHSLAKGAGRHFEVGAVHQTMVEFDGGFLFVVAAGGGTCLAVFSGPDCDVGLVAYEMARLVRRVGEHLFTAPRAHRDTGTASTMGNAATGVRSASGGNGAGPGAVAS